MEVSEFNIQLQKNPQLPKIKNKLFNLSIIKMNIKNMYIYTYITYIYIYIYLQSLDMLRAQDYASVKNNNIPDNYK